MKIITGIASTTHVDKHNERISRTALNSMAEQIKRKYIPQLVEHAWNRHIGVVLYGEVFQLRDKEYALGIVAGFFESEEEKENYKTDQPNLEWQNYRKYLKIDELIELSDKNSQNKHHADRATSKTDFATLLETHLDSTQVLPDGTVYKTKRFIDSIGDLRIEIYPKDHYPAHFHIISKQRRINARFDIETLDLISAKEGKITASDIKRVQDFFKTHPSVLGELKREFSRLNM